MTHDACVPRAFIVPNVSSQNIFVFAPFHGIFFVLVVLALLCTVTLAFTPRTTLTRSTTPTQPQTILAAADYASEVDVIGNNIKVKELLEKVENDRLLSKVAASGLLSKAQAAGITLSKLEPLLELAASNPEILILVEASGPELLPLLPTIVDIAPGALPLLATAVSVPPPLIGAAGLAVAAGALTACSVIPDDSVTNVALQTLIVGLSLPAMVASFAGAAILGQLK